jgi:hypothetical protein
MKYLVISLQPGENSQMILWEPPILAIYFRESGGRSSVIRQAIPSGFLMQTLLTRLGRSNGYIRARAKREVSSPEQLKLSG